MFKFCKIWHSIFRNTEDSLAERLISEALCTKLSPVFCGGMRWTRACCSQGITSVVVKDSYYYLGLSAELLCNC